MWDSLGKLKSQLHYENLLNKLIAMLLTEQYCGNVLGGSVVEWSACRTRNLAVPAGFELRSDHYLDLFLGSPEFKFLVTLVNSQPEQLLVFCIVCSALLASNKGFIYLYFIYSV